MKKYYLIGIILGLTLSVLIEKSYGQPFSLTGSANISSHLNTTAKNKIFEKLAPLAKDAHNGPVLKLAPVPAQSNLYLSLNNSAMGKVTIRVTDMSGRALMITTAAQKQFDYWQSEIDVSSLRAGMYFIEAFVDQQKFASKFIKIGR